MGRLVVKQIPKRPRGYKEKPFTEPESNNVEKIEEKATKKNKKSKKSADMINEEQILEAEKQANDLNNVKVVKKDRGLIERTESSKIILTEDNKQVLND